MKKSRNEAGMVRRQWVRGHGSIAREEEETKVERKIAGQCGSWYEGEGAEGEEVNECDRTPSPVKVGETIHKRA